MLSIATTRRAVAALSSIAALLSLTCAAAAQVATPSLNPSAIETTITSPGRLQAHTNPATLPWSESSRVGLVRHKLEAADTQGGVTTDPSTEGDGTTIQGRVVGDAFAFGVEVYDFSLTDVGGQAGADVEGLLVAGAARIGDILSIGIGQQSSEFKDATSSQSETLPMGGISVRLAEVFFLGGAVGNESVEASGGGQTFEVDRGVKRVGAAVLWHDGDSAVRLEYFQELAESAEDPVTLFAVDEFETDGFSVEANFSGLLLGYWSTDSTSSDTVGVVGEEYERTTVMIGWAPQTGLSIVFSAIDEQSIQPATADETTVDTAQLGLAWNF